MTKLTGRNRNALEPVAVIPAAGHGARLRPFRYPKELFPLGYENPKGGDDLRIRLKVVCQYALECLVRASVRRAFVIVSDHKLEMIRFLSDGEDYRVRLAYLHQRVVNGLPGAIDCAYEWLRNKRTVMVLPDTVVRPTNAVQQVLAFQEETAADVVLGVFPTEHPEDLCPVDFDDQGRVRELFDKVSGCKIANTWGLGVWSPPFTEFLHELLGKEPEPDRGERTLAEVLSCALQAGLDVRAVPVAGGCYFDIGTTAALLEARMALEGHAILNKDPIT